MIVSNASSTGLPEALIKILNELLKNHVSEDTAKGIIKTYNDHFLSMFHDNMMPIPSHINHPTLPLSAFSGEYQNNYFGPLHVEVQDQHLKVSLGNQTYLLKHYTENKFVLTTKGENATGETLVKFNMSSMPHTVTIDAFNENELGVFTLYPSPFHWQETSK